jgi:sugar lactone lactonase YvrE
VKEPNGGLFCLHADFSMHRHASGLVVSNGIAWAEAGRVMYHVDSHPGRIDAYDFDGSTGALSNRRVFRDYVKERAASIPDGCAADAEGGLWVAEVGDWHIRRYAPDGRLDREIRMPFRKPTSVMFGGADLGTLYVTSMRFGLTDSALADQPLAGSLLQLDVGVKGQPEHVFAG